VSEHSVPGIRCFLVRGAIAENLVQEHLRNILRKHVETSIGKLPIALSASTFLCFNKHCLAETVNIRFSDDLPGNIQKTLLRLNGHLQGSKGLDGHGFSNT